MEAISYQAFKEFYEYFNEKKKIQRHTIFHFKAFGMMNLHYEIRICQKIYNRVTMTQYVPGGANMSKKIARASSVDFHT